MRLSLEELDILMTFAESRNSVHAAEILEISQPTLTEKLRAIEAKLPETPFAWKGHKRVLNSYGEHIVKTVRPTLTILKRTAKDLLETEATRLVRISGRMEILMRVSKAVHLKGPLELDFTTSHKALDRVSDGISDLAITYLNPSQKELIRQKLFGSGTAVIIHKSLLGKTNPKTFSDIKDWGFVRDARWYLYREGDGFYQDFANLVGLPLDIPAHGVVVENWLSIKELVSIHKGVAVVPLETLNEEETGELVILPIPQDKSRATFYLVYHREFIKSTRGKTMVEGIVSAFKGSMADKKIEAKAKTEAIVKTETKNQSKKSSHNKP